VMRAGRIEQVGTPREVYEQPGSTFVSSFLGKSNILAGTPIWTPAGVELEVGGRRFPAPPLNGHAGADRLLLSLRPERIRIDGNPAEDGVAGIVRARAFLGNHWVYQVDSALGALLVYRQSGSTAFAEGEAIRLSWDAEDLRVVDGRENGHA
jgi:putative spermidine/putrescine transport system ATP-binding protein